MSGLSVCGAELGFRVVVILLHISTVAEKTKRLIHVQIALTQSPSPMYCPEEQQEFC